MVVAFICIPDRGLAVLQIHKCASSSLVEAATPLGYAPRVHPVEDMVRYFPTRAVMIREPHQRIESAWSMVRDGQLHDHHPGYTDFASWIIDVCERPWTDMHVLPQSA